MNNEKNNDVVIFKSLDGEISIDVQFDGEEIWLNRNQLADLFNRDVKTVGNISTMP